MYDLSQFKFDEQQINEILDKLVPLLAEPKDYEFFRGVLYLTAANSTSASFAAFVAKLLKETRS